LGKPFVSGGLVGLVGPAEDGPVATFARTLINTKTAKEKIYGI
jgi:hypothetical protein